MRYLAVSIPPPDNKRFSFLILDMKTMKSKKVSFGAPGGSIYLDHKNPETMKNYVARHKASGKEDWTIKGIYTPGFWSRWYSWSKPTLKEVKKLMRRKFGIEIIFPS